MDFIMYIIIFFAVLLMIFVAMWENKRSEKKMDDNNFTVRQPKVYLLISILGVLFGFLMIILMTVVFPNDTADLWVYLFFLLYVVFCLIFFIYCVSWKVQVEDDKILYSPFAGINKNFAVSDITNVKMRYGELKAYSGNKKLFSVGSMTNGYKKLASRLQKEQQIQFDF
ncbi:hypothetical protein MmiAt1_17430 [Methanimicrococcus sp. At1]|uniref:DUF5673 domain-containing protein n=1 Tax=Methanimicrococcus hacksteinii TaxID=3028293 RepID=A0ABU3VRU9_9EURY|nr:DUF6560 family protein [Methanimicrococcus sp. At1]MDV0446127.1 hypothetical protein [Methanimicrococcus sp. At1]